jgi:hypothetical protein
MKTLAKRLARWLFFALDGEGKGRSTWLFRLLSWCWRRGRWLYHLLFKRQPDVLLVLDGPRYPLRELVEDELLLAMPLVPMHAQCPQPIPLAAGDRLGTAAKAAPQQAPREHPFAALAALKPKMQQRR